MQVTLKMLSYVLKGYRMDEPMLSARLLSEKCPTTHPDVYAVRINRYQTPETIKLSTEISSDPGKGKDRFFKENKIHPQ